jgi:hypothetical protein
MSYSTIGLLILPLLFLLLLGLRREIDGGIQSAVLFSWAYFPWD